MGCQNANIDRHRLAALRCADVAEVIPGIDPERKHTTVRREWVRDYWPALHPHPAPGGALM